MAALALGKFPILFVIPRLARRKSWTAVTHPREGGVGGFFAKIWALVHSVNDEGRQIYQG